jgi:HPt (histidine-containing phosphotransfer) domain-containing protein
MDHANEDPDHQSLLRDKAILLLKRERELLVLRMAHERTAAWLSVAQSLPGHFDVKLPLGEIYSRVARSLLARLGYQKAMFFDILPGALRPLGKLVKPDRPMDAEGRAFLDATPAGFCNDPVDPGPSQLAALFGLHRFAWSRPDIPGSSLLMVAGFDRERSEYYHPLDDSDRAQIQNMSQQVEMLLRNMRLVVEVQDSNRKLEGLNATLEQKVEERTRELTQRGQDMRLVLDNVAQGFMTIDPRGYLAQERSAIVDRWFGGYAGQLTFAEYTSRIDPGFGQLFQLGHEALTEGILPRDLCLDQLPTRLVFRDREFRCAYSRIDEGDRDAGLLIMISDITEQLAGAQKDAEQREAMALFQGIVHDRSGHLTLFTEARRMMEQLSTPGADLAAVKGLLHTLKGNAGVANLHVMAELCHRAEDSLCETQSFPREDVALLEKHWLALSRTMNTLLGDRDADVLEIDGREIDRLCAQIEDGAPASAIVHRLRFLGLEPVEHAFSRLAKHARELASRLGKGELEVVTDGGGVRIDPRHWSSLWTDLIHLVRNAIDHGFEPPEERRRAGKSERPCLRFEASIARERFVLRFGDDGRGIDWPVVRRVAAARGLPTDTDGDLLDALCTPSLTTRSVVTGTSGRGIGLAVVMQRVRQLGGTLSVDSCPGRGSSWLISFPIETSGNTETVMGPLKKPCLFEAAPPTAD